MFTIYVIENIATGQKYVGQTQVGAERRWKLHLCDASRKKPKCHSLLHEAIRSTGPSAFRVRELCVVSTQASANEAERNFIVNLGSSSDLGGYNIKEGGKDGKHAMESRRRGAANRKGKCIGHPVSASARQRIGNAHRGKVLSAATRAKISAKVLASLANSSYSAQEVSHS